MNWLIENLSTIIVSVILLFAVLLAINSIRKDKANGKSSCGGNCGSCGTGCHSRTNSLVAVSYTHLAKYDGST